MQRMTTRAIAPALKALLEGLIDYAGLFPPAAISLDTALNNYEEYRKCDVSWMLRWFVVGEAQCAKISSSLDGRLSILNASATEDSRAAVIETTSIVNKSKRPVYCEVPINNLGMLEEVKKSSNFAKIRTGGLKPEAIPSTADVAAFINTCADLKLAFKATAGLHHPIRAEYPLTYEPDAPRAVMHGFLNVLMASMFAWQGERHIEPILAETDAHAFYFDDHAHWKNQSIDSNQIRDGRANFMHAIGSCSFDEPVHELQDLGLL